MIGFLRMLGSEFSAWNAQATADYIAATGDTSCTSYTTTKPDTDPQYVWARVEHARLPEDEEDPQLFIVGDIKTEQEAIALGMVVESSEP